MIVSSPANATAWPLWRKILFRFFFIYFTLEIAPWTWVNAIPGLTVVTDYYESFQNWVVEFANAKIFHLRAVLVPINGSGDTSFGWVQLWTFLLIAFAGMIMWSFADYRRQSYRQLNYWLCLFIRYFVALIAFIYGIDKIFVLQMPFPNLSQLATPLGDYLPMRFSWLMIGYSTPYQVFSGVMELVAGLLLLYRRTTTLGVMFATGVFLNVMMLNLSYDIPVKIFSMQLTFCCLFLLTNEFNRIACFFISNKVAPASELYHFNYPKKWMRITRLILKFSFLLLFLVMPIYNTNAVYKEYQESPRNKPFKRGVYEVSVYLVNGDSLRFSPADSTRWQDLIFDDDHTGSINTRDTAFGQRYRRGYFSYITDTVKRTVSFRKGRAVSPDIMVMQYQTPDSNTIRMNGRRGNDSLFIELKRVNRHFQLAEKQFHWLSEYNR